MAKAASVAPEPATRETAFVARQPIFDRSQTLFGYELLLRASSTPDGEGMDSDLAASETISAALHTLGLKRLTHGSKAFLRITRTLLLEETYTLLPPEGMVIELPADLEVDEPVLKACQELREAGYTLALDGSIAPAARGRLLPWVNILKLDFSTLSPARRQEVKARFGAKDLRLLADKVETREHLTEALDLGFDYLQGYFFAKPEVVSGRKLTAIKINHMHFLQELNRPRLDYKKLERVVKQDVSLSYNLLRYLNSAGVGLLHPVKTIQHALVLLGERPLRKWGALVAVTSLGHGKPDELLRTCLVRARFCESLAQPEGLAERDFDLFLMGLLSAIEAVVDQPLAQVLDSVTVADDLRQVLLGEADPRHKLRQIHTLALACERGAWAEVMQVIPHLSMTQPEVALAYYDALHWADGIFRTHAAA